MSELKTTSLSHKDNNTGTPNITMYPDGTTSIGLTQTGGFKNQIINGSMQIAQRGVGPVETTSLSGTYATVDRFTVDDVTSAQVTVNDLPGFSNALNLYGGGRYKVRQSVELAVPGNNCQFSLGSTWTVSLWSSEDLSAGSLSLYFTDNHQGDNFQAVAENLPWVAIETVSGSPNTWTRYSATFTVNASPVSSNKCLNVELMLVAGLLTGVQLEPGPVATAMEIRPLSVELSMCERYYQKSYDLDVAPGTSIDNGMVTFFGTSDQASNSLAWINLGTKMRVPPSIASWNLQGLSGVWSYGKPGATEVNATTTPYRLGQGSFGLYVSVGIAWTNTVVEGHWTADAEL